MIMKSSVFGLGDFGCHYRGLSQNDETEQAARSLLWIQALFYFHKMYRSFLSIDGMNTYRPKRIIPMLTDDEKNRLCDTIESGVINKQRCNYRFAGPFDRYKGDRLDKLATCKH